MIQTFQQRKEHFEASAKALSQKLIFFRLILFSQFLLLFWFYVYIHNDKPLSFEYVGLLLIFIIFVISMKFYSPLATKLKQYELLAEVNNDEINILKGDFKKNYGGENFINHDHAYTSDLDIFGEHSIFKILNRTTLKPSQELLANWLQEKAATREIIENRQQAIQALATDIDFVQNITATGKLASALPQSKHIKDFCDFLENSKTSTNYLYFWLANICFSATCVILFFVVESRFSYLFLVLLSNVNFFVLQRINKRVSETYRVCGGYDKLIPIYTKYALMIEKSKISSMLTDQHKSLLISQKASFHLTNFANILKFIEVRNNPFYLIINILLSFDYFALYKINDWIRKNGKFFQSWINTISEYDVLCSAAALYIAHPNITFAKITEKNTYLKIRSMKHLLIFGKEQIANDVEMSQKSEICILTGVNMGGKSTFLKSMGTNIVLSLAGFPAFAESIETSLFSIFTSMKHADSIEKGESLFYTEIKRVKSILTAIQKNENNLLLFDEILRGTNNEDRYKGCKYLIEKLQKMPVVGWIATHDLQLGALPAITNYSVNSKIENGKIHFDYKVRKGISDSLTAIDLMKEIGIIEEKDF